VSSRVSQLPSTSGIEDPHVRSFCDSLVNAWGLRNGDINEPSGDRFITKAEFHGQFTESFKGLFGVGSGAGYGAPDPNGPGGLPRGWTVSAGYWELVNQIVESPLWKKLGESIVTTSLIPIINGKVVPLVSGQVAAVTRIGAAEIGIANETTARISNDSAFVSSVNTIWATLGGTQAVAWDGVHAVSTAVEADAARWTGVMAAVKDPNTGQPASAGILQEYRAWANSTNGNIGLMYSLRVELSNAGETIVGGFGISALVGVPGLSTNHPAGASIDFGIRADKFWIGSTSTSTLVGSTSVRNVPFIVTTGGQSINGVTYPTGGVWMNAAMICNATIDYAKITELMSSTSFDGTYNPTTHSFTYYGTDGWAIARSGQAIFNNVVIRGAVYATAGNFDRLLVTGAVQGSVVVPNNGSTTYTHGEGRKVVLTHWTTAGTSTLVDMTDNTFTLAITVSGGGTVFFRYF
jgi:hypothetical protein